MKKTKVPICIYNCGSVYMYIYFMSAKKQNRIIMANTKTDRQTYSADIGSIGYTLYLIYNAYPLLKSSRREKKCLYVHIIILLFIV